MLTMALLLFVAVIALAAALFLLGFRLGAEESAGELTRVRMEAARAERQLHDLTRSAFIAMAEEAQRHRRTG